MMSNEQLAFLAGQILVGLMHHTDFAGKASLNKLIPAAVSAARGIVREIETPAEQAGTAAG